MMPDLFSIGKLSVHWYGVMMALGFLAGLLNWTLLGRSTGRDFKFCSDLLFWIMIAGILGARAAYILSDLNYFMANPEKIVRIDEGGLIYFGGFLGAWLALYLVARSQKTPFLDLADFVITSLPLAHAFGRIGCFMNGCCHGTVSNGSMAVIYPMRSPAWHEQLMAGVIDPSAWQSLAVHPVQLYEAAFNLLLFGIVLLAWHRRRQPGTVGVTYLLTYPVGRFLLEFLRGDYRLRWMGLSVAQWISVALFIAGWVLLAILRQRARRPASA
ncbi:MAG: prolipoprotein diacylglyceryl transferase [Lentisphaerae bacterium]|nr:prolipoprotein diacylglyceryl transferase [Lentisphaerota bacterium]